jgi:hypothetical protein
MLAGPQENRSRDKWRVLYQPDGYSSSSYTYNYAAALHSVGVHSETFEYIDKVRGVAANAQP